MGASFNTTMSQVGVLTIAVDRSQRVCISVGLRLIASTSNTSQSTGIERHDGSALRRTTQRISGLSKAFLAMPVEWWTDRDKS